MVIRSKEEREAELQGFKFFTHILPLLRKLHFCGAERDKSGNRDLFYDQYVSLLLLYFFNPVVTGLNAIQQSTELEKVQKLLGINRVSMGSLSEAGSVFDPKHIEPIIRELAAQAVPLSTGRDAEILRGLTAVDGSIFSLLSRAFWAFWQDKNHRGAKLHLHFSVFEGVPSRATVTPAASSETAQLKETLSAGLLYVVDRGYQDYSLYRQILDAGSSFIGRVKDNIAFEIETERDLTTEAVKAGVIRDTIIKRLGTSHHKDHLKQAVRLVVVSSTDDNGKPIELWLITDRLDMPAEFVALGYKYRWTIELFFRWFKQILGCRHMISTKEKAVTMQLYVALIATLLIVIRTGLKANKRTWEMVQYYFLGWATLEELERHIAKQLEKQKRAKNKKQ
jgi:hypothetical protein